jgi:hypothetical protein
VGDPQTIDGAPPDVIEHSTVVSKHDARAVDELTSLWVRLTDELDFHHGEWYARDERGDWLHVSSLHIHDLLFSLGVGESSVDWDNVERKRIIRQFKDRDRQTPALRTKFDKSQTWSHHSGAWRVLPKPPDEWWDH